MGTTPSEVMRNAFCFSTRTVLDFFLTPTFNRILIKHRFVAEMLGMMVVISVGNGAIANEVLKKTKGHALGLGFVAIAYGMAFFLAISMFGHISANVMLSSFVACLRQKKTVQTLYQSVFFAHIKQTKPRNCISAGLESHGVSLPPNP